MYLPIRIGDVIRAVDTFERFRSFRLLSLRRDEYQVAMERCRRMLYEEDVILEPVLPSSASVLSSTEHGVLDDLANCMGLLHLCSVVGSDGRWTTNARLPQLARPVQG